MCLDVVYRGKQKREALAKLPDEFYVWKHLMEDDDGYWTSSDSKKDRVFAGQMKAPYLGPAYRTPVRHGRPLTGQKAYKSGWHAWRQKGEDEIRCRAFKRHIVSIGSQFEDTVVVLSHITFPKKCGVKK